MRCARYRPLAAHLTNGMLANTAGVSSAPSVTASDHTCRRFTTLKKKRGGGTRPLAGLMNALLR